jgi:hypothetical protein
MKLVELIKMCLNEIYSKIRISKNMSDAFPIQNGLKGQQIFITIASHLCFRVRYHEWLWAHAAAYPMGIEGSFPGK